MCTKIINPCPICQSPDENTVTRDLDAHTIEVHRGHRIYILVQERTANGEPSGYWFGRVLVVIGDAVQVLGYLHHYHQTPEAALAALRERYPEITNRRSAAPTVVR